MPTLENYFRMKILNDYTISLLDEDRLGRENWGLLGTPKKRYIVSNIQLAANSNISL